MIMKLQKRIPEHTRTAKFTGCRKDFLVYNQAFIKIRSGFSQKLNKCFWCSHEFQIGESIALAIPTKGSNKVLCNMCANELLNSV